MPDNYQRKNDYSETVSKIINLPLDQRKALIDEYARRSEAAFTPDTKRNLECIRRDWNAWCARSGCDPDPPVSPLRIAEYVDSLGGRYHPNTIELRLWGIGEFHKSQFLPSPCRHPLVLMAVRAIKLTYGAAERQAPPLCKKEVLTAISTLGSSRAELRNKALLWVASDSWCRASEIVGFRVRDLLQQEDGSSLLFIRRSKTDIFGRGDYAYLSRLGTLAVKEWIRCADLGQDDPIITASQRKRIRLPLSPRSIGRIFKVVFDRPDVSAHSTRVGGVHDAMRIGCDLTAILVAGRWRSPEMPARYGRRHMVSQSAAAKVAEAFGLSSVTDLSITDTL